MHSDLCVIHFHVDMDLPCLGAAIGESMPDGVDIPGFEPDGGPGVWANPYNIFTTTACGPLGIRVKVEHASSEAFVQYGLWFR